jgi:PAS domain S-box-containing protein
MPGFLNKMTSWIRRHRQSAWVQYAEAAIAVWVALSLWTFAGVFHRHLFSLLLAAVMISARFLGFGPAVFSSFLSALCLDFFAVAPYHSLRVTTPRDLERLATFLVISVFASSMARQKTLAESRAERTIREMAAVVEYSSDAIYTSLPDGTILNWNRAAELLYGYTSDEIVGSNVARLAPAEMRGEVQRNWETIRKGGHVAAYRTERLRKDGTLCPILLSISPLRNAKGEIVGASAIARDISAEKQSEEAIRRSEKLATAGRLAATMAHEINNPLEAVTNLLYLARHDSNNAVEYLTQAEQEVGRVARLAQQTLGFVRDAHAASEMDVTAIMDDTLQLYSRKLASRGVSVEKRYRGRCRVRGYSGEMRQLVANLLVNAADAMPDGGNVLVRVAEGHSWDDARKGVRITVADSGSGIPEESLGRIFEPFYTTKKDAGTGLGLWVSQGIVEKHGGTIRVRTRCAGNSTGTTFRIFLPERRGIEAVA